MNTPFDPDIASKDFCEYLFENETLLKFGIGFKCGFIGRINEKIVIYLGENSTIIKEDDKILTTDAINFNLGKLYYYFCPIPKTRQSLSVVVV